jgi:neural Wiskott-Aldrich syndrome protein
MANMAPSVALFALCNTKDSSIELVKDHFMSQFATALSWVPMSRNLAATMARACDYAGQQAHRQVTLEHLLLALSDDADASAVLAVSNVDIGQLGADVAAHVSRNENRFTQPEVIDPAADETLVRILDYAAAAARQSRRREINGAVVLAAIIGDGNSTAATILKTHGLTFEAAIKALQKSNAQPKPAAFADPTPPPAPASLVPPPAAAAVQVPTIEPPVVDVEPDPSAEPPQMGDAASTANETLLANVRRKLEATRAAGPVRPAMAPIAPPAPVAPVAPPPVPKPVKVAAPPVERVPEAQSEPVAFNPVDESLGLATLSKPGSKPTLVVINDAPPYVGPRAEFSEIEQPVEPSAPAPAAATMPPPAPIPTTAGADLAKKHDGWLPPPSPTLVTEASKPARRTPPVPPVETRAPPPLPTAPPVEMEPAAAPDWRPREELAASQPPREAGRVTQEAGPPRGRPPVPAPWPESLPPSGPTTANPHPHDNQPPRQTQLREFQPVPAGAIAGPDGITYPPVSQQQVAYQPSGYNGGRPNGAPPPGYPSGPGQPAQPHGQWPPQNNMPPQMPQQMHPQMAPQMTNGQRPEQAPNGMMPNVARPQPPRANAPVAITATVGKLTTPIPTKWRVSQEQVVEVRLSPEELRALTQQLDGRGAAYAHERVVAKAISVRLKAPDHSFAIEPTSPETLWLDAQTLHMSNDGVHWRWQATPQTGGRKKLQLVISARTIGGDGVVAETALPDQTVTVKVGANPGRFALKLLGYAGLLLLGALLARYGEGGIETLMAWKRGFQ